MTHLPLERSHAAGSKAGRMLEVSKVRIGPHGRITAVLWGEVDAWVDQVVGARVEADTAAVIDAIHAGDHVSAVFLHPHRLPSRPFVVVGHLDGHPHLALEGPPSPGRNVADLATLPD
jgi:hypothetical protein